MASAGPRAVFGVLLNVIVAGTGIAYAQVSSAIAIARLVSYGVSETFTSLAFSVYGAAVMLGCLICGFLCNKFSMKYVLTGIFASRVVWPVILILMPKNEVTIIMIVILLGLTGAATMTPTSGLTEKLFGADNLATLFGVVFLSHQVGSFFSAWIGGLSVELTGDYVIVWQLLWDYHYLPLFLYLKSRNNMIYR